MAGRLVLAARLSLLATIVVVSLVATALEASGAPVMTFAAAALGLIGVIEHFHFRAGRYQMRTGDLNP
jgi:hypothetical protein